MNDPANVGSRPPDDYVTRKQATPDQPPSSSLRLVGFWANSDRDGYRRVYLEADLNRRVDFRTEDVIEVRDVAPDQSPFSGEKATAVTLKPEALVDFTTRHGADEFVVGPVVLPPSSPHTAEMRSRFYRCR